MLNIFGVIALITFTGILASVINDKLGAKVSLMFMVIAAIPITNLLFKILEN